MVDYSLDQTRRWLSGGFHCSHGRRDPASDRDLRANHIADVIHFSLHLLPHYLLHPPRACQYFAILFP